MYVAHVPLYKPKNTYLTNKNTMNTQNTQYAPAVEEALNHYNSVIDGALAAAQKLESICITEHLAEMFWVAETDTAQIIKEDYLQVA